MTTFQRIFEGAPVAIGLGRDGRVLRVNRAFALLYGYARPEELEGRPVLEHIAPEFREEVAARHRRFAKGEILPGAYRLRGLRRDGTTFPLEVRFARVELADGPATAVFGTDLTERAEELRASEERLQLYQEIVARAQDAISVVDRDRVFVYQNRAHEELLGFTDADREGRSPTMYVPAGFEDVIRGVDEKGNWSGEMRHLRKSGERCRLAISAYAVRTDGEKSPYYVAIKRDVTARHRADREVRRALAALKRAQAQLVRSEKLASIGMLVSGLAHELNNPLNVIFGNLQLLASAETWRRSRGRRTAKVQAMVRDALGSAFQAREVMDDFRTFARNAREAEDVDVNRVLREAVARVRRVQGRRVRVVASLGACPRVRGFGRPLGQVFLNLIKNAAEAIPGRGRIEVRSARRGRSVRVEVEDGGTGIPSFLRRKIFEPFFTTKPPGRGMGLGLSISALVIQNHGGRISFRSRVGRGSTFRVDLPAVPPLQAGSV